MCSCGINTAIFIFLAQRLAAEVFDPCPPLELSIIESIMNRSHFLYTSGLGGWNHIFLLHGIHL
jgi:hypothetical protein